MKVFAISDLHLSFDSNKPMDIFGPHWESHPQRIKEAWLETVNEKDIVLIPGDISWAMKLDDAMNDLNFIGDLPGMKVIIKGNHDYWWSSLNKIKKILPDSIMPLQNNSIQIGAVSIAGSRLWIDSELKLEQSSDDDRKLFQREMGRFSLSLKGLQDNASVRIIMTHFPPISNEGKLGKAVQVASSHRCSIWVFGHIHLDGTDYTGFNRTIDNIRYEFVSADFLNFCPKLIYDTDSPLS